MSETPSSLRSSLTLEWLPGRYAVCRLDPAAPVPDWASRQSDGQAVAILTAPLVSITRTDRELSIVIEQSRVPPDVQAERGFIAVRIAGTLPFDLIGILAKLTGALAEAGIACFAISTFETDYVLVRDSDRERATIALQACADIR